MRKVIFILFTCIVMLIVSSSYGEVYSARNGVMFLMSPAEVKAIEAKNIPDIKPRDMKVGDKKQLLVTYPVPGLMGFDDARLQYLFSLDQKLIRIQYYPFNGTEKDIERTENGLSQKYGSPHYSAQQGTYCLSTDAEISSYKDYFKYDDLSVADYKQWLLRYDDCYVCITFIYAKFVPTSKRSAQCELFYTYIPHSAIDTAIYNEIIEEEKEQKRTEQLMNDL